MYDKTSVLPPTGSLREALFLTVWLKRQEQELQRTRLMAQGLMDITMALQRESSISPIFKEFMAALLPHTKKAQLEKDEEVSTRMRREVEKGVITFKAPQESTRTLVDRAHQLRQPDEFRRKLSRVKRVV